VETKKKAHRERKNGAAREAWTKAKVARNATRGKQVYVTGDAEKGVLPGWCRMTLEIQQ